MTPSRMSNQTKILLIVFGSLLGAIVLGIVGFGAAIVLLSKNLAADSHDTARSARIAAKIATFRLPPGYRYMLAMDALVTAVVEIVPSEGSAHDFTIQLQSVSMPAGITNDKQLLKSMESGMHAARLACSSFVADPDDRVTTAGGMPIALRVEHCADPERRRIIEFGRIPGNAPFVTIMAAGTPERFDRHAVHQLLASLK